MTERRFVLLDGIAVVVLMAVVLQMLVACAGNVDAMQFRTVNMEQVRDIHRGLVSYSQMNSGFYPGISSSTGKRVHAIPATDKNMYGAARPTNKDISAVYAILLTNNMVTPEGLISPVDSELKTAAPKLPVLHTVKHTDYSYAVLQFGDDEGNDGRRREWADTGGSMAPVVGDRASIIDIGMKRTSPLASDRSGEASKWQGTVGWNDNHITFETTGVFAPGRISIGGDRNESADDLFDATDGFSRDANAKFSYR